MARILQLVYTNFFLYFIVPLFILVLIGKPAFLIRVLRKILHFREPIKDIKVFNFIAGSCAIIMAWNFYSLYRINETLKHFEISSREDHGHHHHGGKHSSFVDEKTKEAHLCERNAFIFLTFVIMIIVLDKFTDAYQKLWNIEAYKKNILDKSAKLAEDKKKD
jgi:hypothetical protein